MTVVLAIDTSGDVASVAVRTAEGRVRDARVAGARRHASELLPMAASLLADLGGITAVRSVLVADGPGSFTGLRVGAAVAKALVAAQDVELRTASTLAARAASHAPPEGGDVLVATSALRGEAYMAGYRVGAGSTGAIRCLEPARPVPIAALSDLALTVDVVVADLPGVGVPMSPRRATITTPDAGPSAAALLGLLDRPGGTVVVTAPDAWEPEYGRPVEAQTRWEAQHGRPLPHSAGTAG
jgi:tRNA threonylcarbamoyladenosine biosynthesis protein TsaB